MFEEKIKKPIKLVPTKNWSESLAFAKEKKCDILPSIVKTQEREKYFNFTKSYLEIPFVLSTKSDVSFINNLSSLNGKKISIVKDYAIYEILKNKYNGIEFVFVNDIDDGFKKVLSGETFGHIDAISTSWYKIQNSYLSKISISFCPKFS